MTNRRPLALINGVLAEVGPPDLLYDDILPVVMTPYYIPNGVTFTVPDPDQMLFAVTIDCDGFMAIDGLLIEV